MAIKYRPPYPWFGGKLSIAADVALRFGSPQNVIDPFFGGGSSLWFDSRWDWARGNWRAKPPIETVNDLLGHIPNFWRSVQADPQAVALAADRPVFECELHAIHLHLTNETQRLAARLEADPAYYDAKLAGWWVWGLACWIGGNFCGGGPWVGVDGELVKVRGNAGRGVNRKLPHVGNAGRGVNRQLPHVGNAGRGVNRKLPHVGNAGQLEQWREWLLNYMAALRSRLRRVRVCCGDWGRVLGPTPTTHNGLTAVWLDPPYIDAKRKDVYALDSRAVAAEVWQWCADNGDNDRLRIGLCGYAGDYEPLPGWEVVSWSARGGYGNQSGNENRHNEIVLFSPHCLKPAAMYKPGYGADVEQLGF